MTDLTGLIKLFLHEVLPDSVEKAIYVDANAFFLTDPALLWDQFSYWGLNIAVSISLPSKPGYQRMIQRVGICSCIMLLRLDRLRSVRLMDLSIHRDDRRGLYGFCTRLRLPRPHLRRFLGDRIDTTTSLSETSRIGGRS